MDTINLEKTVKQLEMRGHKVSVFASREEALQYLASEIRETEVGIGGCMTAEQMGLYEKLSENNVKKIQPVHLLVIQMPENQVCLMH